MENLVNRRVISRNARAVGDGRVVAQSEYAYLVELDDGNRVSFSKSELETLYLTPVRQLAEEGVEGKEVV